MKVQLPKYRYRFSTQKCNFQNTDTDSLHKTFNIKHVKWMLQRSTPPFVTGNVNLAKAVSNNCKSSQTNAP